MAAAGAQGGPAALTRRPRHATHELSPSGRDRSLAGTAPRRALWFMPVLGLIVFVPLTLFALRHARRADRGDGASVGPDGLPLADRAGGMSVSARRHSKPRATCFSGLGEIPDAEDDGRPLASIMKGTIFAIMMGDGGLFLKGAGPMVGCAGGRGLHAMVLPARGGATRRSGCPTGPSPDAALDDPGFLACDWGAPGRSPICEAAGLTSRHALAKALHPRPLCRRRRCPASLPPETGR